MSSQDIATRSPQQELVASVRSDEFRTQVALALPEGIKPERFQRVVVTALLDNPDLAGADHNSIFQAALHAAKDGLLPDGRQAAFVLFGGKAQYIAMIGGLRKIAAEYGWSLRTRVVYANDEFDFDPVAPSILHRPVRPGAERGDAIAAYAVATHKDGRREIEVMDTAEIEKVRAVSRAKDRGPWVDWWERMAEKTVGRRLFAQLPLDESDRRVASVLEASEPGEAAVLLYGPHNGRPALEAGPEVSARPAEKGEELAAEGASDEDASPSPTEAADGGRHETSAAAPAEPEPDLPGKEFEAPAEAALSPEVIAANAAAEFPIPTGKWKGLTLREVADKGADGTKWLRWCLRHFQTDPLRSKVWEFCRIYAPDLFEQVTAEKELAS